MAKTISNLSVILGATVSPFNRGFASAAQTVTGFVSQMKSAGMTVLNFTGIAGGVAAALYALKQAGGGLQLASDIEQTEISLSALLKSADKAKAFMAELRGFAIQTPFKFGETAVAAKQLLAYGSSVGEIRSEMTMLGDIAAGVKAPIGDLVYLYGTLRAQGRAYAVDVKQFANRGIPIYEALAKTMGVNKSQIRELVEEGKVGFPQIQAALASLTNTGGLFSGLMEKLAKSMGGLWNALSDNIGFAVSDIIMQLYNAFGIKDVLLAAIRGTGQLGKIFRAAGQKYIPIIKSIGGTVIRYLVIGFRAATAAASFLATEIRQGAQPFIHLAKVVAGVLAPAVAYLRRESAGYVPTLVTLRAVVRATTQAVIVAALAYAAARVALVGLTVAKYALTVATLAYRAAVAAVVALVQGVYLATLVTYRGLVIAVTAGTWAMVQAQVALRAVVVGVVAVYWAIVPLFTLANFRLIVLTASTIAHRVALIAQQAMIYLLLAALRLQAAVTWVVVAALGAKRAAIWLLVAAENAWWMITTSIQVLIRTTTAVQWLWIAATVAARTVTMGLTASLAVARGLWVAMRATIFSLTAAQLAWRAATIAGTAAQWLLNVALTANPIGIVVMAIAALVAALVVAIARTTDFTKIVTFMKNAFEVAKYAILNWRDTLNLAFAEGALFVVRLTNQISYFFGTVVPALLTWFANNWRDIFQTAWNFTKSVFVNMATNAANFFKALWSWMKGDGFNFQWTGLLEGFKNTISEMPKIAERVKGPLETQLEVAAAAALKKFKDGFAAGKSTGKGGFFDSWVDSLTKVSEAPVTIPEIPMPEVPVIPPMEGRVDIDTTDIDTATEKTKQSLGIIRANTAQAQALRFMQPAFARAGVPMPVPARSAPGGVGGRRDDLPGLQSKGNDLQSQTNRKLDRVVDELTNNALVIEEVELV